MTTFKNKTHKTLILTERVWERERGREFSRTNQTDRMDGPTRWQHKYSNDVTFQRVRPYKPWCIFNANTYAWTHTHTHMRHTHTCMDWKLSCGHFTAGINKWIMLIQICMNECGCVCVLLVWLATADDDDVVVVCVVHVWNCH